MEADPDMGDTNISPGPLGVGGRDIGVATADCRFGVLPLGVAKIAGTPSKDASPAPPKSDLRFWKLQEAHLEKSLCKHHSTSSHNHEDTIIITILLTYSELEHLVHGVKLFVSIILKHDNYSNMNIFIWNQTSSNQKSASDNKNYVVMEF